MTEVGEIWTLVIIGIIITLLASAIWRDVGNKKS